MRSESTSSLKILDEFLLFFEQCNQASENINRKINRSNPTILSEQLFEY